MTPPEPEPQRSASGSAYALTGGLVGLATAVGALSRRHIDLPDLVLLYLLVVVIAAARFGRGPSFLAATLSVLAFDFFFIPPTFTLLVSEKRFFLTFAMMLVVGLLTSGLTQRIRRQEHEARLKEQRMAALHKQAEEAAIRATTEEMRSSLLSAVSHDLRTPLAAITGAATALRDDAASIDGGQRLELLSTICEEADRLERLVRNLLDMTRLESGALAVKREWIPLEEVVGSALTRLEPVLAGRPVRTDLPADLPLLSADPILLEQVFVNLLENAAKHTSPGTEVDITARADAGGVVVEVADRGPGIAPGEESRVFEKFFRGKHVGTSGAGLGLAICRGVVNAHGGTMLAANRAGGAGAIFRVTLPRGSDPPPGPPDLEALPSDLEPAT